MKPLSTKKRSIYFTGFTILFLIGIPLIILYAVGYRIDGTFATFKTGGILVQTQFSDTQISLNGVFAKRSGIFQRNVFLDNLKAGQYLVEVQKDGYQAWKQNLPVLAEQVTQASAFILPQDINFQELTQFISATSTVGSTTASTTKKIATRQPNSEYTAAQKMFVLSTSTLATTTRTFQKIMLTRTTSTVTAMWTGQLVDAPYNFCLLEMCLNHIMLSASGIRAAEFYPGRSDVVVIAAAGSVYAQQIDARDLPPVQMIYQGTKPEFRFDGETIYVRDGGKLFKAEL